MSPAGREGGEESVNYLHLVPKNAKRWKPNVRGGNCEQTVAWRRAAEAGLFFLFFFLHKNIVECERQGEQRRLPQRLG